MPPQQRCRRASSAALREAARDQPGSDHLGEFVVSAGVPVAVAQPEIAAVKRLHRRQRVDVRGATAGDQLLLQPVEVTLVAGAAIAVVLELGRRRHHQQRDPRRLEALGDRRQQRPVDRERGIPLGELVGREPSMVGCAVKPNALVSGSGKPSIRSSPSPSSTA
jgi:hypothetical protein